MEKKWFHKKCIMPRDGCLDRRTHFIYKEECLNYFRGILRSHPTKGHSKILNMYKDLISRGTRKEE